MSHRPRKKQFKPTRKWTNAVRKVISKQTETKAFLITADEVNLTTTTGSALHTLNNIVIGTGNEDRVGVQVKGFGLALRMALSNLSTSNVYVRLIVIGANNNEFDAITDGFLWQGNSSQSFSANNLRNIYQQLNKRGFSVHLNQVIRLNGTASVEGGEVRFVKRFLKFNHKIQWDTISTGDATSHNMRLIIVPVDALGDTASTIEYSFSTTYYYQDY